MRSLLLDCDGDCLVDWIFCELPDGVVVGRPDLRDAGDRAGNVFVALLAHYWLHEDISWMRWMGIVMITVGVAFVAQGPVNTTPPVNAATAVALEELDAKEAGR